MLGVGIGLGVGEFIGRRPGLAPKLDLNFASTKSLTASKGPTPSFSRASTGSYFDGSGVLRYQGYNLCQYSEDFTNAFWTKSLTSISSNVAIAPNGQQTADKIIESASVGFHSVSNTTFNLAASSTASIYLKAGERGFASVEIVDNFRAVINLSDGTVVSNTLASSTVTTENAGNGWWRVKYTTNSSNLGRVIIYPLPTSTFGSYTGDGTSGIFAWGVQVETGATANQYSQTTNSANSGPRFNHTFNGTSWVSKGLLVEEQRTSFSEYSESIENWTQDGATTTSNQTSAPDGNSTGDLVAETTSNSYHAVYNAAGGSVTAGQTWTQSVFVKKGSGASAPDIVQLTHFGTPFGSTQYCNFNISTGVITASSGGTGSIVNCGNGWYRIAWTATAVLSGVAGVLIFFTNNNPSATRVPSYTGSTSANVFVWGGQVEQGSFATSYIRNLSTGSTTRSADVCQITGGDFSSIWNGTEGSVVAEYDRVGFSNAPNADSEVWNFANSSGTNQFYLDAYLGNEFAFFYVGSAQANLALGSTTQAGTTAKVSTAWNTNDFAATRNGGAVVTDISGSVPVVDRLGIGRDAQSNNFYLNGHIARLRYYNKRLPNATLQLLSDPDPTLNLQFALNKSLTPVAGPAPSFSRASTGTFFNASGVLTSASINTPRFDHVYSGGQWVSRGLLVEEQRTNLCLYSNPYAAALDRWGSSFVTLTPNSVISPDGTQNATSVVGVNTAAYFQIYYYFNQASGTYTQSFFLKSNGANIVSVYDYAGNVPVGWYDLENGTSQAGSYGGVTYSATIINVGNGWYRCTVTNQSARSMPWIHLRPVTAMGGTTDLSGNGVRGFYVYGVQGETGAFATSLIQTNGSALTRSADVCQITGTSFGSMWNQGEGSVVADFDFFSSATTGAWTALSNTTNIIQLYRAGATDLRGFVYTSGVVQADFSIGAYSNPSKSALAYKTNDFAGSANGAAVGTDTSGTIPSTDKLYLMAGETGSIISGHIAKLIYYPARLTNTKLQQLST